MDHTIAQMLDHKRPQNDPSHQPNDSRQTAWQPPPPDPANAEPASEHRAGKQAASFLANPAGTAPPSKRPRTTS